MARRRTHRRKTSYSRLYGYTHKKEAVKDASMLRRKGHSVKIRREKKVLFGRKQTIYGVYTKD